MLYQFQCKNCSNEQEVFFYASEYDDKVSKDGKLKRTKCEKCKSNQLYRYISIIPSVRGGTKNYKSLEKFWSENKDLAKQHEDRLGQKLQARKDNKMKKIDQGMRESKENRYKNYDGREGEQRLKIDE